METMNTRFGMHAKFISRYCISRFHIIDNDLHLLKYTDKNSVSLDFGENINQIKSFCLANKNSTPVCQFDVPYSLILLNLVIGVRKIDIL